MTKNNPKCFSKMDTIRLTRSIFALLSQNEIELDSVRKLITNSLIQKFDMADEAQHYKIYLWLFQIYCDTARKSCSADQLQISKDATNLLKQVLQIRNKEYKTELLKVLIIFLRPHSENDYDTIKKEILDDFEEQHSDKSICVASYGATTKCADKKFFELIFFLKERNLAAFDIEFRNFLRFYEEHFGDFWPHAIELNARILYHTAKMEGLDETCNYITQTQKKNIEGDIISQVRQLKDFYTLLSTAEEHKELVINKIINCKFFFLICCLFTRQNFKSFFTKTLGMKQRMVKCHSTYFSLSRCSGTQPKRDAYCLEES